ncbi:urease accessory protein UreD [Methylocapsa sp. S129]|uniref:urease accessory protein UreD n=1 Tax=Methylocapsa sp. S129 TaxID=1641869 RepID=UPI00131AB029|nr:urease accessory protein UreD [Methylocapsa sp. S129]
MTEPAYPVPPDAQGFARRARGEARADFARVGARTEPARVFETGGLRLRFPRTAAGCEAVLINTGGGMVGGDHANAAIELGAGAQVLFTTQSAEKIYRSDGETSEVDARATLGAGARLEWLPQETILFEGARFRRRLTVDLAADASLLLVEAVIFGRIAMGERSIDASLRDSWRIRRGGRLVFAEELRLDHASAILDRPAVGRGARAIASILIAAPDAQAQLDKIRAVLDDSGQRGDERLDAGASAFNGLTLARLASPSPDRLRAVVVAVMMALRGRAAPRVWS